MKLEQFTHASQELIHKAAALAQEKQNSVLTVLHTLAASIKDDFCRSFFYSLGLPIDPFEQLLNAELARLPKSQGAQLAIDPQLEQFLNNCQQQAKDLGDTYISLETFLLGWATTNSLPQSIRDFFAQNRFTKI